MAKAWSETLFRDHGFATAAISGATPGAFSRSDAPTPDDFEMPAAAVKP
jgi:hypothetical protein